MKEFYSQCGEDRWIIENLILPSEGGLFIEVGAGDGVTDSNTLAFEQLDWTGLLIEPLPHLAAESQRNRGAKVWCVAAGDVGAPTYDVFYWNETEPKLSGLVAKGYGIPVIVAPLRQLWRSAGFNLCPDLVSIDTEGTELDVVRGLGEIRPKILIIEYQTGNQMSRESHILQALARDYRLVHKTEYNLILVHSNNQYVHH